MRALCDVCESAAALLFCAADEAALCLECDDKVHKCNKLASRHVRVGLDDPVDVPRCDICEKSPAFFYCEIDGSSLCLQCDTVVHVGGKRTHPRYLLFRQRVEFPGDGHKPALTEDSAKQGLGSAGNESDHSRSTKPKVDDGMIFPTGKLDGNADTSAKMEPGTIDLNIKPHRLHGQDLNNQPG